MKRSGVVAKACLQIPTGPGFESQVPHAFVCYFSIGDPVLMPAWDLSYSLTQMLARWPQARSGGLDVMSTVCSSQSATLESEKSASLMDY